MSMPKGVHFNDLDGDPFFAGGDSDELEIVFPEHGLEVWPFRRLSRAQALYFGRILSCWGETGELTDGMKGGKNNAPQGDL